MIAVLNSVIAFYYYSKVVLAVFMQRVPDDVPVAELREHRTAPALQFALVLTTIGVVVLGIFPSLVAEIGEATKTFASGF